MASDLNIIWLSASPPILSVGKSWLKEILVHDAAALDKAAEHLANNSYYECYYGSFRKIFVDRQYPSSARAQCGCFTGLAQARFPAQLIKFRSYCHPRNGDLFIANRDRPISTACIRSWDMYWERGLHLRSRQPTRIQVEYQRQVVEHSCKGS